MSNQYVNILAYQRLIWGSGVNQNRLLVKDANENKTAIATLSTLEWILLAVGLGIAGVIAFFSIRSIVTPVVAMTDSMGELAAGDKTVEIPGTERTGHRR